MRLLGVQTLRGVKEFSNWLISNWERVVFAFAGLILLAACLGLIIDEKITEAAILFGLSLLSFIYANVAKFKRFKGFGIEAELWEDKQKEAADLIHRLRGLVETYSTELLMSSVKAGRWGPSNKWADRWKLYDELVGQHRLLGQQIDFSKTKKEMDDYFLFDMTYPQLRKLEAVLSKQRKIAFEKIESEFSKPISDLVGYNERLDLAKAAKFDIENSFSISCESNLAQIKMEQFTEASKKLTKDFEVIAKIDQDNWTCLQKLSVYYQNRPVKVTTEMILWADKED